MTRDLVFVGDVHLDRDDADLPAFLAFLDGLAPSTRTLVLLGDLFNLWIGRIDLEQPHQRAVVEVLTSLRRRGVGVRYVEGNRDYRIADAYAGRAFDDVAVRGLTERIGDRSVFAIHGDLVNRSDRNYRLWRRLSRSAPAWAAFNVIPRGRRLAVAEQVEARLRTTNREMKRAFPEAEVRAYAAPWFARGHDTVVLGHFHDEVDLTARPPSPPGRILVVPLWKSARRYLRVAPDAGASFVDS